MFAGQLLQDAVEIFLAVAMHVAAAVQLADLVRAQLLKSLRCSGWCSFLLLRRWNYKLEAGMLTLMFFSKICARSMVLWCYAKAQDTTPLGVLCSLQVGLQVCPASATATQKHAVKTFPRGLCKQDTAIVQIFSLVHRKKPRISFVTVLPICQDGPQFKLCAYTCLARRFIGLTTPKTCFVS